MVNLKFYVTIAVYIFAYFPFTSSSNIYLAKRGLGDNSPKLMTTIPHSAPVNNALVLGLGADDS